MFFERITEGAMNRAEREEVELVRRAQNGDTLAFAELMTKFRA